MGSSDKFCLRWSDFEGNVSRSFASIRDNSQFFDCTLTTDDDEAYSDNLRAHKVILSACSKFFKNILTKESMCAHPNPLIYLKGISAQELKYILDFIYHGEVNVAQHELDRFLEVAETLKIKGLTQRSNGIESSDWQGSKSGFRSLSPGETYKKLKLLSAMNHSPTMSPAEPFVKTECDPLIHIGTKDLEESIGAFGSDNEDYEDECEGDDVEVEKILSKKCLPLSSNGTKAAKRTASATSPSSDEPEKKVKVHYAMPKSPITNKTEPETATESECGTLAAIRAEYFEEREKKHRENEEQKGHKGKHLTETEKTTLVNLIKTLDTEYILQNRCRGLGAKRKILWGQIVPAFNEICGLSCDKDKLKGTLNRIKRTPRWKSRSALFGDL